MVEPDAVLEVTDRVFDLGVAAMVGLELSPTWTSFEWPGADGTGIADTLDQAGILDEVLAIYRWDEPMSVWLAYFPSLADVSGINTFAAGHTYWFAVSEPLTWTLSP